MSSISDCRVSTDPQEDNTSFDEQEAACREYCNAHGFIVGEVWRETHTGMEYRERLKLEKMRKRYRERKIKGVVFRTYDRLGRKEVHLGILLEEMEHYGVEIHCTNEKLDDTLLGKVTRMLLGLVAEMEWEKICERTMTGRLNKAKQGKLVGGREARYGWKWVLNEKGERDHLALDKQKAAVLRWAGKLYADGVTCLEIIRRLKERHILSPHGDEEWHPRTLRNLLTDERNIGKGCQFVTHTKKTKQKFEPVEMPPGTYPRIMSDSLYARIMARATANEKEAARNGQNPEAYLLRAGFVRCAECGNAMVGVIRHDRSRPGLEWFSYVCTKTKKCPGQRVKSVELDTSVWNEIVKLADHVEVIEEAIQYATNDNAVQANLDAVERSLANWKQTADNYTEDLKDHNLRGDTRASIRALLNDANERIERLEQERLQIIVGMYDKERERKAYGELLEWCKKVKEAREELTYQQKRDFLRMLGVVVLVNKVNRNHEEMSYDIRVTLPSIQEILYQNGDEIAGRISTTSRMGTTRTWHWRGNSPRARSLKSGGRN